MLKFNGRKYECDKCQKSRQRGSLGTREEQKRTLLGMGWGLFTLYSRFIVNNTTGVGDDPG